jgi:glycosyltransferase involved in cell wall biosynthesis
MGLNRLLDASHRLHEEGFNFDLVIGGDGPMRGELEQQAMSLGLVNSVSFLGKVDDEILPLAYAACDAFVLPTSELECFGLIALEALSAGRPVLATPVGAIPEIIRNVDPAWLSRTSEAVDIANLLRGFLAGKLPTHSPEELHEYVCRNYNREFVLGKFIKATSGGRRLAACRMS